MGLGIGTGIGLIRKALFVMTGGLSGRVFKDDSKKKRTRTAKAPERQVRAERQPKATPVNRDARRPKPRAARTSTAARATGPGNGTANALERIAKLHRQGALSDEEFAAAKARILGTDQTVKEAATGPATYPAVEANVAAARQLADLAGHDSTSVATITGD
jgi:putative oligomerization/nucleic acid binding protein